MRAATTKRKCRILMPSSVRSARNLALPRTLTILVCDAVTFKVRSFRTTAGEEIWDFGDGSEKVTVKSNGNVNSLARDGYAVTVHRFVGPGQCLVRVERTNERGQRAIAHLYVPVAQRPFSIQKERSPRRHLAATFPHMFLTSALH
jgi:hypothetical protein